MVQLDSDLLRTFLAVAGAGRVTDGARTIGRSQSATSLQIQRLETLLGQPLFERTGRGVALTDTGQRLLPVAKDVTNRLDRAFRDITADGLRGRLRIGLPDDHGRAKLSRILAEFAQSHPHVELEVTCSISTGFPDLLSKGQLDLAVYEVERPTPDEEIIYSDPTCWAGSEFLEVSQYDPVPVALFDRACWWRDAALSALEARAAPYRIVFSSQSVSGVCAAVEAGIAVGLLGRSSLPSMARVFGVDQGFPEMPMSHLIVATGADADRTLTDPMVTAVRSAFAGA